jgi:hypothetical protein
MAHWGRSVIGVVVCVTGVAAMGRTAPPVTQDLANRNQILAEAKAAQYSLLREGMQSVHATATFDWATFLDWQRPQDASDKAILGSLAASHYEVTIDDAGTPSVESVTGAMPANATDANAVLGEIEGMRHTLESLLNAWTGYMAATVLPPDDVDMHIAETGGTYDLKYFIGETAFAIDMNAKFEMARVWEKDTKSMSEIHPAFDATPKGFVLKGYEGSFESYEKNRSTTAKLTLEYETVDGLLVPQTLTELVPGKRGTDTAKFSFTDYKVTRRAGAGAGGSPKQ